MADKIVKTDDEGLQDLRSIRRWWRETHGLPIEFDGVVDPHDQPPVPFQVGIAKQTILPGSGSTGGKVHFYQYGLSTSTGTWVEDTSSTYQAFDFVGVGASSGEQLRLWRHYQSGQLHVQSPTAQRCYGNATTHTSAPAGSFFVDTVKPLWGASPTTSSNALLTIKNTHNWTIDNNALCRFEYNRNLSQWEAYQVTCPAT